MSTNAQNRASLITFLIVMGLLIAINLKMVSPYFMSIMVGALMAILAHPLQRRLEKHMRPTFAAGLVTAIIITLILGPLALFATMAVKQAVMVAKWVAESDSFSLGSIFASIANWGPVANFVDDAKTLQSDVQQFLRSSAANFSSVALDAARGLPENVLHLFLSCLACYFFLLQGQALFGWLATKVPMDDDIRVKLQSSLKETAISVVWASMAAAAAQSSLTFVVFLVMRVPAASLAMIATFILAWIPLVGSLPVWLAGFAYLALQGAGVGKLIVMGALAVVATTVDNFVRPLVLRGRGEMHPLVSLVAIFGGIRLFGISGVFFGPILAAVLITLLDVWPVVGRRNGLHFSGQVIDPSTGEDMIS